MSRISDADLHCIGGGLCGLRDGPDLIRGGGDAGSQRHQDLPRLHLQRRLRKEAQIEGLRLLQLLLLPLEERRPEGADEEMQEEQGLSGRRPLSQERRQEDRQLRGLHLQGQRLRRTRRLQQGKSQQMLHRGMLQ